MCQEESWGAIAVPMEANSTLRGQPPRIVYLLHSYFKIIVILESLPDKIVMNNFYLIVDWFFVLWYDDVLSSLNIDLVNWCLCGPYFQVGLGLGYVFAVSLSGLWYPLLSRLL